MIYHQPSSVYIESMVKFWGDLKPVYSISIEHRYGSIEEWTSKILLILNMIIIHVKFFKLMTF